jgi:hypothetical protein
MPAPSRYGPLAGDRAELAADPRWLRLARRIAAAKALAVPWLADEFESAAGLAVVEAARSYDPAFGVDFEAHLALRVRGAVRDAQRATAPKGFRRRAADGPLVLQYDVANDAGMGLRRAAGGQKVRRLDVGDDYGNPWEPAWDGLPVGWEAESAAGVEEITRPLPRAHRTALRLYFCGADTATGKAVGARMGLGQTRACRLIAQGIEMLRELNGRA